MRKVRQGTDRYAEGFAMTKPRVRIDRKGWIRNDQPWPWAWKKWPGVIFQVREDDGPLGFLTHYRIVG
jgi:hypothetical protein